MVGHLERYFAHYPGFAVISLIELCRLESVSPHHEAEFLPATETSTRLGDVPTGVPGPQFKIILGHLQ